MEINVGVGCELGRVVGVVACAHKLGNTPAENASNHVAARIQGVRSRFHTPRIAVRRDVRVELAQARPEHSVRTARQLEAELGRAPTSEELAEATGLPIEQNEGALSTASASVSLKQTVGADGEGELGDLFADREALDPFEPAEESLRCRSVRKALDALPERERTILVLRFGLNGEPFTLEAIGLEIDFTRERVRASSGFKRSHDWPPCAS